MWGFCIVVAARNVQLLDACVPPATGLREKHIQWVWLIEKWEFLVLCESVDTPARAAQSDPRAAHAHKQHDLVSDNAFCMCTSVMKGGRPRRGQSLEAQIRDFRHLR